MVEWHDQLNEHEYKQILGDTEGQGSPWGLKEQDMTQQLNNNSQVHPQLQVGKNPR